MPNLYIISGCNGAGKTTASYTVLPEILSCKEFINADEIAKGLSPFQPETVSFHAGRIMLERINELLDQNVDFAIETTLTTLSYLKTVQKAKQKGYTVSLVYFWLDNVDLAVERVKIRVKEGGHNIPEEIIKRRYFKGIKNLLTKFIHVCDNWIVINNSNKYFNFVAEGNKLKEAIIYQQEDWNLIKKTTNEK